MGFFFPFFSPAERENSSAPIASFPVETSVHEGLDKEFLNFCNVYLRKQYYVLKLIIELSDNSFVPQIEFHRGDSIPQLDF